MNSSFTTQAGNFLSNLESGVDPRTGQFNVNIPVARINANRQLGPEIDLSLRYSSLTNFNSGFGTGFSLPFSRFDNTSHRLELSNGETYMVEPGSNQIKGNRLNNFIFAYSNGSNELDGYKIIWKEGKIEYLKAMDDRRTFVATEILSPLGHKLTLEWGWSGAFPLLHSIRDANALLCSISYGTFTRITVWPDTPEEHTLQFELERNDNYLGQISRKVSEQETLRWAFSYDYQGQYGETLLMTGISYPTGLSEKITYNKTEGHNFPVDARLPWLPYVQSFIRTPGANQAEKISYYDYTQTNFLGYTGDFGNWEANRDYIVTTLTDYTYGSQEQINEGGESLTISREYNNYHLLLSERTRRGGSERVVETDYYAEKYLFIDNQPSQFQLPRQQRVIWKDPNGNERREVTHMAFDTYGNPTEEVRPDGTRILYTWYPAEGEKNCPPEPNGFVRLMKSHTTIPPESPYESPTQKEEFTYTNLGTTAYVVQHCQYTYSSEKLLKFIQTIYNYTLGSEFGRITIVGEVIEDTTPGGPYLLTAFIETSVENHILRQKVSYISHLWLKTEMEFEKSVYSGLPISQTDRQGVRTQYQHDSLGRIILQTDSPETSYKKNTVWNYVTNASEVSVTQFDSAGNATRAVLDGLGRRIRQERLDAGLADGWHVTEEYSRNAFGEILRGTAADWIDAGGTGSADRLRVATTSENRYDYWGERSNETLADGSVNLYVTDPVKQTRLVTKAGTEPSSSIRNGSVLTRYNSNMQPLSVTRLNADGNNDGVQSYEYDGLGRLCRYEDEYGNVSLWSYDDFGRVSKHVLADGSFITKEYTPHLIGDFPESIRMNIPQANGSIKTIELGRQVYDDWGRLTESTSGGRTYRYEYREASPVPSIVITPAGERLEYAYIPELDNAVRSMRTEKLNQDFIYDPLSGNLTKAIQNGNHLVMRSYFPSGMLAGESVRQTEGTEKHTSYRYSLRGALLAFTDVTGQQTSYRYDQYGRLHQISDPRLKQENSYDTQGRLSRLELSGEGSGQNLSAQLAYDDFGREVRRDITIGSGGLLSISQEWQRNNLLKEKLTTFNQEVVRRESYEYDSRLRLVRYDCSGEDLPADAFGNKVITQSFEFDPLNNIRSCTTSFADGSRDQATFSYENSADAMQLTAVSHTHGSYPAHIPFSYDLNGRVKTEGNTKNFSYDALGRLSGVSNEVNEHSYRYDGLNRLFAQYRDGSEGRQLFYGQSTVANEVLSSGEILRLVRDGHTCLGISRQGEDRILLGDRNDSPVVSTAAGQADFHKFLPYGFSDGSLLEVGFNGERPDPFTGLYHLGNGYRQYNPLLMRFTGPDSLSPFGAGGINPYAYCQGDPINYTDPTGHASFGSIFGIVVGALGVLAAAFTGGASIVAAGGVIAAMSSASAISLTIGTVALISDVTAITAGAMELNRHPYAKFFTWLSFGTGLAGGTGAITQGYKLFRGARNVNSSVDNTRAIFRRVESDRALFTIDSRSASPSSSGSGISMVVFQRNFSFEGANTGQQSSSFIRSFARPDRVSADSSLFEGLSASGSRQSLASSDNSSMVLRNLSDRSEGLSSARQSLGSNSDSGVEAAISRNSGESLRNSARSSESSEFSGMLWDYENYGNSEFLYVLDRPDRIF